jgi:hypothetical protein
VEFGEGVVTQIIGGLGKYEFHNIPKNCLICFAGVALKKKQFSGEGTRNF